MQYLELPIVYALGVLKPFEVQASCIEPGFVSYSNVVFIVFTC